MAPNAEGVRSRSSVGWRYSAVGRSVHAVVAVLAASGVFTSLYMGWTEGSQLPEGVAYSGEFAAGWEHMLNQLAYFTVLSGLLVMVSSTMLALRVDRPSGVFQVIRLSATVQIIITGAVFNLLLRDGAEFTGVHLFNDQVLHQILPVLVPLVWLIAGPHGRITGSVVLGSTIIPVSWLAATLIRGPYLDWYPYTILDVPGLGYSGVAGYVGAILLGFIILVCGFWALDRLSAPRR